MKKIISSLFALLPVSVILLIIVEIILTNQTAGSGKVAHSVDISIDVLRQENELLAEQVASASSLMTISAKAKEMGLREAAGTQYLTIAPQDLPVAYNGSQ
jgi:hypothetical protein